jgi:hypothetical protein
MSKVRITPEGIFLGSSIWYVSMLIYASTIVRVEERALKKHAHAYTVIDSARTTDWNKPKLDTVITIPISASKRFNMDASRVIQNGLLKVTPLPKTMKTNP